MQLSSRLWDSSVPGLTNRRLSRSATYNGYWWKRTPQQTVLMKAFHPPVWTYNLVTRATCGEECSVRSTVWSMVSMASSIIYGKFTRKVIGQGLKFTGRIPFFCARQCLPFKSNRVLLAIDRLPRELH